MALLPLAAYCAIFDEKAIARANLHWHRKWLVEHANLNRLHSIAVPLWLELLGLGKVYQTVRSTHITMAFSLCVVQFCKTNVNDLIIKAIIPLCGF